MTERLRPLWDFQDLDASEERFRAQLSRETTDEGRAEVLTQLARIEGLRGDFDRGETLIEEAEALAGDDLVARTSVDSRARSASPLERGRRGRAPALRVGGSDGAGGARTTSSPRTRCTWRHSPRRGATASSRGHSAGSTSQKSTTAARYWLGPLLNNLGWEYYEAGELEPALDAFERALRARERDPSKPEPIALARYAVGKALRGLGRSDEAIPLLEQAVAWAEAEGAPDGWYHEELAEEYAAVGREGDAREQARLAIPLLLEADPGFEADEERVGRLRALAGST